MSSSGGSGGGMPNTPGRSNVSITSINCTTMASTSNPTPSTSASINDGADNGHPANIDVNGSPALNNGNHFYGNGSIRISVPKMDESDESETELTHIESKAIVNMRAANKNGPRPMSWEGELSENEDPMDTEGAPSTISNNGDGDQLAVPQNLVKHAPADTEIIPLISKDAIKPEYSEYMSPMEANSGPTIPNSSNKRLPVDLVNLKYEPGLLQESSAVNSPLLARSKTTLLPANPSPDSAIHSVYTHSSPSQSPLTSRHAPYTPSLSRNNSDASYSSCYSYSSEFSPTHSPIQGRHNMYNNFNGSPLHHSVLYKPMVDGEMKMQSQPHEDSVLEAEAIPSAGISRQQLINR